MIRQYIGARYVTKIYENSLDPSSAEWESGRSYEPLTLVTYLNSSYLSKKEVPASVGDPAANPAYWVITGAYNGQIMQLQNQINVLNSRFNRKIDNIICVGDSYGTGANGWYNKFASYTNASDIYPCVVSGASFANPISAGITFLENLQAIESTISDPNAIQHVLICGGINDAISPFSTSDITAAMTAFDSYVRTTYPNAEIHLAFVGNQTVRSTDTYQRTGTDIRTVIRTFIAQAAELNWHYLNNSQYIMKNATFLQASGLHPTTAACEEIARQMILGIIGGSCDVHYLIDCSTMSGTTPAGITQSSGGFPLGKIHIDNDVTSISITPCTFDLTGVSQSASVSKQIKLFEFSAPAIIPSNDENLMVQAIAMGMSKQNDGSNYFVAYPVQIELYDGSIYLLDNYPLDRAGTGWGSATISNVNWNYTGITCSTMML